MKESCSLALIYEIAYQELGPDDAKKTVSGVLISVLNELEKAEVQVTSYNLEQSLALIAERFASAAGKLIS